MWELLGIVATLFVLGSFTVDGERKIRKINIVGAALFIVYGIAIGALSVWLLNSALLAVHIYKLRKL